MKYISMIILLTAMFLQISCKNNDPALSGKQDVSKETDEISVADQSAAAVKEENVDSIKDEKHEAAEEISEITPETKGDDIAQADISEPQKAEPEKKIPQKPAENKSIKDPDEKGIVAYVDGRVRKKMIDEAEWDRGVEEQTKVKSRESYRTMKKSRAELELAGMDILRLAPKTTVDLIALYEETKEGKEKTDIKLEEGDLWAQVNSADDDSEFMMDTDIAAAAITGTNFRMSKTGELTEMKVYHGEVKISNAKDKMDKLDARPVTDFKAPQKSLAPQQISGPKEVSLEEWVFIVKNMQQITFDKKGKVVSAGEFKATDIQEQTDWVKWNKKRDRQRGLK